MTARKFLTPLAAARMQKAMEQAPHSRDDLVKISGLTKPLVTRYINELYGADPKVIHVGDWARDARGYPTIRCYSWGDKPDAPCPKKYANDAERMRLARAEKARVA